MRSAPLSLFITGGAKRIGAATAKALAQKGAKRILIHYNKSKTEALKLSRELKSLGAKKISLIHGNLESFRDVGKISEEVLALAPDLNAVVFNASVWEKTPFGKVKEKDWDSHMNTNLKSAFFLAQDLGLAMKKNGFGRIVVISDWSALKPNAHYIPYCLSKTGLLYLTQALARALAPQVKVNAILPGAIMPQPNTPKELIEKTRQATLLKRLGSPEDIAQAVCFFLEANFTTGSWFAVDGGRLIA